MAKYALQKYETIDCDFFHTLLIFFGNYFDADAANVQFPYISEVLEMTVAEMKEQASRSAAVFSPMMLHIVINLVRMACRLMSTEAEISSVQRVVRAAVQTKCRPEDGLTVLHLAILVSYNERRSHLPSSAVVKSLLAAAGAAVNSMDAGGNTPLHVAVFREPETSRRDLWLEVIDLLLQYGAHVDFANYRGETASDMLPPGVDVVEHVSLRCLAARAVRTYHVTYRGIVPTTLADFH